MAIKRKKIFPGQLLSYSLVCKHVITLFSIFECKFSLCCFRKQKPSKVYQLPSKFGYSFGGFKKRKKKTKAFIRFPPESRKSEQISKNFQSLQPIPLPTMFCYTTNTLARNRFRMPKCSSHQQHTARRGGFCQPETPSLGRPPHLPYT